MGCQRFGNNSSYACNTRSFTSVTCMEAGLTCVGLKRFVDPKLESVP